MDITGRKFRNALIGGLSAVIWGCDDPKPNPAIIKLKTVSANDAEMLENPAYSVSRVATFNDDLAYGGRRGIYEIIDNKTGNRYIGVSGIGICELGSHKVGKNSSATDER